MHSNALDQKILNRYLLENKASISVRRLPTTFWASSAKPPPLSQMLLHHANFVIDTERRPSSDPSPKRAQLDVVKRCFDEDDGDALDTLVSSIEADASLKKYRERHFPDPGAWAALP